ncbi:MAG: hypothetical protein QXE47_01110 [Candidatus Anstonellales archaeon]
MSTNASFLGQLENKLENYRKQIVKNYPLSAREGSKIQIAAKDLLDTTNDLSHSLYEFIYMKLQSKMNTYKVWRHGLEHENKKIGNLKQDNRFQLKIETDNKIDVESSDMQKLLKIVHEIKRYVELIKILETKTTTDSRLINPNNNPYKEEDLKVLYDNLHGELTVLYKDLKDLESNPKINDSIVFLYKLLLCKEIEDKYEEIKVNDGNPFYYIDQDRDKNSKHIISFILNRIKYIMNVLNYKDDINPELDALDLIYEALEIYEKIGLIILYRIIDSENKLIDSIDEIIKRNIQKS